MFGSNDLLDAQDFLVSRDHLFRLRDDVPLYLCQLLGRERRGFPERQSGAEASHCA